ncbi:DUF6053 domain-containing protein [Lysobacter enzymogenes]|uniref:DUF6053 domain-containing protein n=1 Tax=Lysobacter enzymogenes TaxID=69 RepID=UPI003D2F9368
MGGPSGPTLSVPITAISNKSIGPEGPPTVWAHPRHRATRTRAASARPSNASASAIANPHT